MAFVLDPEATSKADVDRFVSMSVTRNPDAVVRVPTRRAEVRPVLATDDIEGARPRSLPPHTRSNFHDTGDIEGARPKPLHFERRNKPDFTTTNADIEGASGRTGAGRGGRTTPSSPGAL